MKKIILGSILTAAIVLTGTVQAKIIDKHTEANLIKICEAIKSDSKIHLYKTIKRSGISARAISKGLVCNGYDPVTFAIVNDAKKTAKYLALKGGKEYAERLAKL